MTHQEPVSNTGWLIIGDYQSGRIAVMPGTAEDTARLASRLTPGWATTFHVATTGTAAEVAETTALFDDLFEAACSLYAADKETGRLYEPGRAIVRDGYAARWAGAILALFAAMEPVR